MDLSGSGGSKLHPNTHTHGSFIRGTRTNKTLLVFRIHDCNEIPCFLSADLHEFCNDETKR